MTFLLATGETVNRWCVLLRAVARPPQPRYLMPSEMSDRFQGSRAHFVRARKTLAGGVSTAFRATQLPIPICFDRGSGSRLVDVDGNEYFDYALGFGPMFLGHHPQAVVEVASGQPLPDGNNADMVFGGGGYSVVAPRSRS